MILTTAALIAIATAASFVEGRLNEQLLACAADRYRAAGALTSTKRATDLTGTKGMGAIAPAGDRVKSARLSKEGDDLRRRAASKLTRSEITARYSRQGCSAD